MSTNSGGRPFNALGQILSEGGDIGLASAIARDNERSQTILIAHWLQMGASDSDIDVVRDIADRAVIAGQTLTSMDPYEAINPLLIPTNSLLFGQLGAGLRYYASADYQLASTGLWYRADFKLPDLVTTKEILVEMLSESQRRAQKSPEVFGVGADIAGEFSDYKIQLIVGRF